MVFDTHVHTKFSTDSDMKIEDALKTAENDNLSLVITEHMDINYPEKGEFLFDVKDYFDAYSKFKSDDLLLGIEIGMKEDCVEQSRKVVYNSPFDYVIGSVHLVDDMDLYYGDFYKDKIKQVAYEKYLQVILKNVKKFDFIDSLGHIDYICRYAKYENSELKYSDFSNMIDEIFKNILCTGKCIELNTRRLNSKPAVSNLIGIYKRYSELGGKYITLGSDAHTPDSIGNNFDIGLNIAEKCNLKIVHFLDRKMEY
ncbi:histidinol phosphate phosphatase [Clostridium tyrobutyricum]|uniref:histidinol phosphate phosphatase n=1 Tax=Clostridium tyrobutyricum TaxID=1519 RepID=UPI001C391E9C|nr:histidinol phosphate phosphatase [Clostridium tyrobutyricum]